VLELGADRDVPVVHELGGYAGGHVEVAAQGRVVYAAWLDGQTLRLLSISDGTLTTYMLPEVGQLVDLAVGPHSVVVVVEFANNRNLLILRNAAGDLVRKLNTSFRFHPVAVHVRSKLRIVGQCLFDAGCSSGNPVVEINMFPGGSAW